VSDFEAWLASRTAQVEALLDAVLPPAAEPPAALHAAMRHLLFPGGKRLRPAFALAACEAAGADAERAWPAAAAVELVHTYSLVHDDLPCMDDDAVRRGRPTVHVAYGEAVAVLAGDALLAHAFLVLARAAAKAPPAAVAAAVHDLAHAAGSLALVGGQADDLAFEPGGSDEAARVESVHRRKSAALIAASLTTGARLGGADDALVERLRRFGEEVGVAFQIADDLLDEGDDTGCSLVRVLGAKAARARAEELLSSALGRLDGLGGEAEPLRELARRAVRRER
jgi:geranylgeranyl diphosphate synthase type II